MLCLCHVKSLNLPLNLNLLCRARCYPFPMFPRAFDLIVFDSVVAINFCLPHFLLEIDRLVRCPLWATSLPWDVSLM